MQGVGGDLQGVDGNSISSICDEPVDLIPTLVVIDFVSDCVMAVQQLSGTHLSCYLFLRYTQSPTCTSYEHMAT